MENRMSKKVEKEMENKVNDDGRQAQIDEIINIANRTARNTIAVIDGVTSRGGFKGEELTGIGQLRDACIHLVSLVEVIVADKAEG